MLKDFALCQNTSGHPGAMRLLVKPERSRNMKTSFCLLTFAALLSGCSGAACGPMDRVELPAHLDVSALRDPLLAQDFKDAAILWYAVTDGGVDLLSGEGPAIKVTTQKGLFPAHDMETIKTHDSIRIVVDSKILERYNEPNTMYKTYAVATHEIGHVLGLKHTTTGIMQPNTDLNPSCIDAAAVREVCESYPCGPHPLSNCLPDSDLYNN